MTQRRWKSKTGQHIAKVEQQLVNDRESLTFLVK